MKIQPFTSTDRDGDTLILRGSPAKWVSASIPCRSCGCTAEVVLRPEPARALRDWLNAYLEEAGAE
jgi:hypothetical protein